MISSMYTIKPHGWCKEGQRPSFVFNFIEYELRGGSANPPAELKFDIKEIVLIEDDFVITRHMASYYWWWNKESANDCSYYSDAYCKAYGIIQELRLVDEGYPLYELKKELALIKECQCLDDVRYLKRHLAAEIRWHDVRWQRREYSDCGEDRVTWALIPRGSDGSPKREPKFLYRSGYWEWGSALYYRGGYSIVSSIVKKRGGNSPPLFFYSISISLFSFIISSFILSISIQ